jgi:hypothetical protein
VKETGDGEALNSDSFFDFFLSFSCVCVCVHVSEVLGFELRASHLLGRHLSLQPTPQHTLLFLVFCFLVFFFFLL